MLEIPANGHSSFLFVACQVGAEPALKKEMAREHPEFRFAFSRPGFVTFKRTDGGMIDPGFELRLVFARAYGLSYGKLGLKDGDEKFRLEEILRAANELKSGHGKGELHLHVWERDQFTPGEEALGFVPDQWAAPLRDRLSREPVFSRDSELQYGDWVFDVIAVEKDEWWVGAHLHSPTHSPFAGGNPRVPLPKEAPSRAYLKLEEAIRWPGVPVQSGDFAVEIGSAPGGAVYSLLKRGVSVVGVDPGAMDPVLARAGVDGARFRHLKKSYADVVEDELPSEVEWVLLDMNSAPEISIPAAIKIASMVMDSLLGVVLTIKLNQWCYADQIPIMLDRLKVLGIVRTRVVQLPSNKQEMCIVGLTRKGLARLNG